MAWPQTNLSCFIYNGKRYNVCSNVYCVFRIMLQLDRKDTWRAAPTLVARTCGDACLHQGLGVGRTKTVAFNRQPRVGKLLWASISWWRNSECIRGSFGWYISGFCIYFCWYLVFSVLRELRDESELRTWDWDERWEMRVEMKLRVTFVSKLWTYHYKSCAALFFPF